MNTSPNHRGYDNIYIRMNLGNSRVPNRFPELFQIQERQFQSCIGDNKFLRPPIRKCISKKTIRRRNSTSLP